MKITLKNVKFAAFASEETTCFSATIYIDGKTTGTTVGNDGHGGCNHYHGGDAEKRLMAYAKTLPPVETDMKNPDGTVFTYPQDADSLVDAVFNEHMKTQELKRICKGKTCFRIPGEAYNDGEYHTLRNVFNPSVKDHLVKKYGPTVFILNENLP